MIRGEPCRQLELERAFQEINEKHFANHLPEYRILIRDLEGLGGDCSVERRTIHISPRHKFQMVGTLAHEMTHAYLRHPANMSDADAHGEDFQREIRRLIQEGCIVDTDSYVDAVRGLSDSELRSFDQADFDDSHDSPEDVPLVDIGHLIAPRPTPLPEWDEAARGAAGAVQAGVPGVERPREGETMSKTEDSERSRAGWDHLAARERIRRAIDDELGAWCDDPEPEDAIAAAAPRMASCRRAPEHERGKALGIDSARVAAAFVQRVATISRELNGLLSSPVAQVAAATGAHPETALADVALSALHYISNASAGLDVRCEDLRQELNDLEAFLRCSGERGEIESWEPAE